MAQTPSKKQITLAPASPPRASNCPRQKRTRITDRPRAGVSAARLKPFKAGRKNRPHSNFPTARHWGKSVGFFRIISSDVVSRPRPHSAKSQQKPRSLAMHRAVQRTKSRFQNRFRQRGMDMHRPRQVLGTQIVRLRQNQLGQQFRRLGPYNRGPQ